MDDGTNVKSERGFLLVPKSEEAMAFFKQKTEKIVSIESNTKVWAYKGPLGTPYKKLP